MNWKTTAVVATGAVATGCLLYYLLKDEEIKEKKSSFIEEKNDKKICLNDETEDMKILSQKKINVHEISKKELFMILRDIMRSQEKMKVIMKDLTKTIIKNNYDFEKTCENVKKIQYDDPLEKYGITMQDFETLFDKHQNDPIMKEAISTILGGRTPISAINPIVNEISKSTIIKTHEYMAKELQELVKNINNMPNKSKYDMKTLTIAAQALVGAKMEEKFKLDYEDIESALFLNYQNLVTDPEFEDITFKMQATMSQLVGSQYGFF